MNSWLLLHYKIPSKPSASRVYVWRKLKSLGAILWQDAVWVLPATTKNQEQFQWLASEIHELEGEAVLWESRLLNAVQEESLVNLFLEQVEPEYAQILLELEQEDADLGGISRRFQQIKARDYFQSALGQQIYEVLLSRREGRES